MPLRQVSSGGSGPGAGNCQNKSPEPYSGWVLGLRLEMLKMIMLRLILAGSGLEARNPQNDAPQAYSGKVRGLRHTGAFRLVSSGW